MTASGQALSGPAPILRALATREPVLLGRTGESGVSGLTLRENTERPITIKQDRNAMFGRDVQVIRAGRGRSGRVPEMWDGHAADRIAADLYRWLQAGAR